MGLNKECEDTAYVLGRLFAILEMIQKDANGEIKSTIRDRYFNSACTRPASVFPIIIKLKNSHMKKIERDKRSLKEKYENILGEIMSKLELQSKYINKEEGLVWEVYPKRLSLEEQGKFILGYYHQMQEKI